MTCQIIHYVCKMRYQVTTNVRAIHSKQHVEAKKRYLYGVRTSNFDAHVAMLSANDLLTFFRKVGVVRVT